MHTFTYNIYIYIQYIQIKQRYILIHTIHTDTYDTYRYIRIHTDTYDTYDTYTYIHCKISVHRGFRRGAAAASDPVGRHHLPRSP